MSEEEKEAIYYLKNNIESYVYLLNNDDKRKDYYIKEYPDMEAKRILLNLVEKQQKEIEEKTTILLAGAEKVKELEKGNHSLMESRKKWKDRYYKEKAKNRERDKYNITTLPFEELKEMIEQNKNISIFGKEYISKDKIKETIEHYNNELEHIKNGEEFEDEEPMYYWGKVALENLLEGN